MTELPQADSKPISARATTITLLAGAIAGAILGLAAWSLLLTTSQAIAIVGIGRYDPTQAALIEEPSSVIERVKSSTFVAAVAARARVPELATLLLARQYGGAGALIARSPKDTNLVEIRINSPQPELAQKAITAVVDELIADHEAKAAPLIQNLQSTLTVLDQHASEMVEASHSIAKRLGGSPAEGEAGQDSAALLSARALTETGLGALLKSAIELRMLTSNIRTTQVVAAPTVTTPKAVSLFQIVAAGAIAGFLVGLLLLQIFPGFFRTARPHLGIDSPDPRSST